jgi:signal transduction histidine kinase
MIFKTRLTPSFKSEHALLAVVIFAASCMILINYFTIKTLSAVRAYSDGESRYSKGQKDAARNLIMFVNTQEPHYWSAFQEELAVPIGDSIARVGLQHHAPDSIIRNGFLAGRNHPDDIDDLIWVFRNFQNIAFMKTAIQIWKEGDFLIGQEMKLGMEARQRADNGTLTPVERENIISRINAVTIELTVKERAFLATLGAASRSIKVILFYANVIMTLLIIGSTFLYARQIFRRLQATNKHLETTNEELDKFVYSASHDLRSPISSLMGLLELSRTENNPTQRDLYLHLMQQNLSKQDSFLRDLIDFTRNKKTLVNTHEIDLIKLIDDVVEQHSFIDYAAGIDIRKEILGKKLRADEFRLKIILNNLLSNAIKYSDPQKKQRTITIRTLQENGSLLLQVTDNGIGIKREDFSKIFDMFYASGNTIKSSGLGLYITHETVQKLSGKITVESQPGIGSTFSVMLPNQKNHHNT